MAEAGFEGPAGETEKPGKGQGISIKLIILVMVVIVVIAAVVVFLMMPPPEPPPGPECGNGDCEEGESYLTCPSDCQAPPAAEQGVVVNPETQTVGIGDDVTVNVVIYNASDLYGFQFDLNYDSSILEFKETVEGAFLNENGGADTFYVAPSTSTPGLINNLACARKGQIGGVDGDGTLATITFTALSSGTSSITLSNVMLSDSQVKAVQFTSSDGEVVVQ